MSRRRENGETGRDCRGELTSPSTTPRRERRKSERDEGKGRDKARRRRPLCLWAFLSLFFYLSFFVSRLLLSLSFPSLARSLARSLSLSLCLSLCLSPLERRRRGVEREKGEGFSPLLSPRSLFLSLSLSPRFFVSNFPLIYKRRGPFPLSSRAVPLLPARAHKQSNALSEAKSKRQRRGVMKLKLY